jgi:membrane-bound lytic murein transglycosylase D
MCLRNRSRKLFPLAILAGVKLCLLSAARANAAYDATVAWSDLAAMDLRPILRSQYASEANLLEPSFSPTSSELALADADSRINPQFRVPRELRENVAFWLRIYTELTTQQVVLFDERHPDVIYDVLDYRELARTARNQVVYEIIKNRRTETAIKAVRAALKSLAKNPRPRRPTPLQRKILTAVRASKHKHSFRELARGLRSQTGQRDNVIKGLLAAEAFFPNMERIFLDQRVPIELTRLALVESSFNLNAVSRAGATGVWQFMRRSADEYMLVDEKLEVDERLSPLKSTVAAAKLLRRNHRILGSWPLAVTSYNHGIRNLLPLRSKGDARSEKRALRQLIHCNKLSRLGWASRNYYSEFLAVLHAEAYRHVFYGTPPIAAPKQVRWLKLPRRQSALAAAIERGIPLQQFRLLNPDVLNLRKALPKGFVIALPGEGEDLASVDEALLRFTAGQPR